MRNDKGSIAPSHWLVKNAHTQEGMRRGGVKPPIVYTVAFTTLHIKKACEGHPEQGVFLSKAQQYARRGEVRYDSIICQSG